MAPPNHPGIRPSLYLVVIAGLLAGLVAAWLWASEPWQRPIETLGVADAAWLAMAIFAFATAVAAWPTHGIRRWGWRTATSAALCAAILPGFLHARRAATVDALLDHDEVMKITTPGFARPEPTSIWQDHLRDGFVYGILPQLGIRPPPSRRGLETTMPPDAYDHLLETSRWSTRRAFIQEIIGDPLRVRLATQDWHRLFPAVVGQDVTLAHRNELLDWLDGLSSNPTAPVACRDAATFWMALIVLTDAEAFGHWSERTLTTMLANQDPPMSSTGDVWMRALDLLIALAPEEQYAELVESLTRDATRLRRALRQRVRGMEYHAAAITPQIELLDKQMDRKSAAAMWCDLKRIAKNSGDDEAAREIHAWLGLQLEHWLMSEVEVALEYFQEIQEYNFNGYWIQLNEVLNYNLSDGSKQRLTTRVRATLDAIVYPSPAEWAEFPDDCRLALIIAALLDDEERIEIHNQIAVIVAKWIPHWVQAESGTSSTLSKVAWALNIMMDDLDGKTREILRQTLLEWCVLHEKAVPYRSQLWHAAVVLDLASKHPQLSGAERIAISRRVHGEVPRHSMEDVEEFIRVLISNEEPARLGKRYNFLRRQYESVKSISIDLQEDHLRFLLVLQGKISPEHLPADTTANLRKHGAGRNQLFVRSPETWSALMGDPDFVRELLGGLDLKEHRDYHMLIKHLKNNPPPPEIRQMILEYLMRYMDSQDRAVRITAFHWLLYLSDWLDGGEQFAFRASFQRFFETDRPSLDTWARHDIHEYHIGPGDVLMHRGEQIPWEDDALSAAYSWSSEIHHNLAIFPWSDYQTSSIFRHLHASGCLFIRPGFVEAELVPVPLDETAPDEAFHDPFPSPLLEVTPWQRARSLHLRRPDLKFPDRPIFRPKGERVHLHHYRIKVYP